VFVAALALLARDTAPTSAQVADRTVNLPPVEVEELDATSAVHLEHAQRYLAAEQWSEAVEAIRRVQENGARSADRVDLNLPSAGFERYVPVSEYCQWRLGPGRRSAQVLFIAAGRSVGGAQLREGSRTTMKRLQRVGRRLASRYGTRRL
jgi:hypothetical protein